MAWIARLSHVFYELRVVYSAREASSAGTKAFLETHYATIKELNPGLPMYVRPFDGIEIPYVAARGTGGAYLKRETGGMTADQVLHEFRSMLSASTPLAPGIRRQRLADVV